ncbi:ABC transporter substrate-binding protein [Halodesulfovibrio marinisediminis]|uniref:Putative spermidine/putrescine transport system substrate-binding protein n=1 Tax=Halodesulfovibrio marinisediminis DSM 17456 TaxID=1121457 RepID=A0A1N6HCI2_9BACT|nr:ABC transporter substrate-binding protein [Halodesulfovibrio marinisediminis]SIO17541.1 putative spermidine/putrescine transport system substrate-binding protein [Halodesulfovibrio marinisediminis DSM 17456]
MKQVIRLLVIGAACLLLLLVTGCGSEEKQQGVKDSSWEEHVALAKGSTVRFYMYGGMNNVNDWIDNVVTPAVKEQYGVTIERVPMSAPVFMNKMLAEKSAGKAKGSIDLLWINGENFKNARKTDLLEGPVTQLLPNFKAYVNPDEASTDFGYPVEGYEAPYGRAQFVFEYDSVRTPKPPISFAALKEWVKENPGRFTYPSPPDFTGSAFIRQAFYAVTGGHTQYLGGFDQALYDANAPKLWAYLNEIAPYLWQEGRAYPKDPAFQATLFSRGEIDMMMAYHPTHAQNRILDGTYPESVRTFVMNEGSIYNTHFTAIPKNASNKSGALVVMNYLISPEAQLSKFSPKVWGDFPVLDMNKLPTDTAAQFAAVNLGVATLKPAELNAVAVPEIPSEWLEVLEKGWEKHVLKK